MISLPNITLILLSNRDFEGAKKALDASCEKIKWGAVKMIQCVGPNSPWDVFEDTGKPWLSAQDSERVGSPTQIDIYRSRIEIKGIDDWNRVIIQELPKFIDTSHALLIHQDGYIIHPELWNPEWLNLDYLGAPWPLPSPTDTVSYRNEEGGLERVGNSVSLRSKKLMDLVKTREWKPYYGFTNEDGFICCHNRKWLESQGCKFAPLEVAKYFSKEHEIPENQGLSTFAFHTVDL